MIERNQIIYRFQRSYKCLTKRAMTQSLKIINKIKTINRSHSIISKQNITKVILKMYLQII